MVTPKSESLITLFGDGTKIKEVSKKSVTLF